MSVLSPQPPVFTFGPDQSASPVFIFGTSTINTALPANHERSLAPLPSRPPPSPAPSTIISKIDLKDMQIMPTTEEAQSMPELSEILQGIEQEGGIEAMMEKQYRMLRFDCSISIRAAIWSCVRDLSAGYKDSQLAPLLKEGGGIYRAEAIGCDTGAVPLISDIRFTGVSLDRQTGLAFHVSAQAPPGPARNPRQGSRFAFWRFGKRLMSGGMVALVTHRQGAVPDVRMAVVASEVSFPKKGQPAPSDFSSIAFSIAFPNPSDAQWAIYQLLLRDRSASQPIRFLLENPILFVSFKPFLHALQHSDTAQLGQTIVRSINFGSASDTHRILLPAYSAMPGFEWNLNHLMRADSPYKGLRMKPSNEGSVDGARRQLQQWSKLDPSQADAIVSALTQELCLIQGPPGTGKTFTGVELLRIFVLNNVGPIIVMAQTNHALDNILRAAYDSGMTKDIIRLGAGSEDRVLKGLSLRRREQKIRKKQGDAEVERSSGLTSDMKKMEQEMAALSARIMVNTISPDRIKDTLATKFALHNFRLHQPPNYIQAMIDDLTSEGGWELAGKDGGGIRSTTAWTYWREGGDIKHLQKLGQDEKNDEDPDDLAGTLAGLAVAETDADPGVVESMAKEAWAGLFEKGSWDPAVIARNKALADKNLFIQHFGLDPVPLFSVTSRYAPDLMLDPDIWAYSSVERERFWQYLEEQTRLRLHVEDLARYKVLVAEYDGKRVELERTRAKIQAAALQGVKIVGCTTNGAARLKEVIQTLSPKVLIVEEAGQALEAHILAALSPSIQHVIQIGDPQQLRCITNCHDLSVESAAGAANFRLNESMMERLSSSGYPMTQLRVQRRMRPEISALIRKIYPGLGDHERVKEYPGVRGATKDVFFFDHRHKETASGEGGQKKANPWEAKMAAELALYFAKQGCYPEDKGVVILCAYAGQVMEVKKCLEGRARIKTGEKEKETLARMGTDANLFDDARGSDLTVMVRTIDSFQGEEADVIILSLVRNSGSASAKGREQSIGFLKTNNRINVAISRAKHGLFMLGNAPQLASQSTFWWDALDRLRNDDCIGVDMPLVCEIHGRAAERGIRDVDDFKRFVPNGGCSKTCGIGMPCGHTCQQPCHPADREHRRTPCVQPCRRPRSCAHSCKRRCSDPCGLCEVAVGYHVLRCGHEVEVKCYQLAEVDKLRCTVMVAVPGVSCEHLTQVLCGTAMSVKPCDQLCGIKCEDCGNPCTARCLTSQRLNRPEMVDTEAMLESGIFTPPPTAFERLRHAEHKCRRDRGTCGHACQVTCTPDHQHSFPAGKMTGDNIGDCNAEEPEDCMVVDVVDGRLCDMPCERSCVHQQCDLPCHMPCDIPRCDEGCTKLLKCGHQCPSVCGEPCEKQTCPSCFDGALEILTADGNQIISHRTRKQAHRKTTTHDCGVTIDIAYLDSLYDKDPTTNPTCPACKRRLFSARYCDQVKRKNLQHFEQHVVASLSDRLDRLGPISFDLAAPVINALVSSSIADLILDQVGRLPNQGKLDSLLAYLPTYPNTVHPIQADIFDTDLQDLFCFCPSLRLAWLTVAGPTLRRYASLQDCLSPAIHTPRTIALQIRGILQSVGCRLILALFARVFIRVLLANTSTKDSRKYAAHLFDILSWTILRSCERDLRLSDNLSDRFEFSDARPSILGYRIILSQSIILHLSPYPPVPYSGIHPYLDRSISRAEGVSKDWIEAFSSSDGDDLTAAAAHQAQLVKTLERIHWQWKGIRACLKGSRVYDMAKGLKDGFECLATFG